MAPRRALILPPIWAGLASALAAGVPFAAPFLLPLAASWLVRSSLMQPGVVRPFVPPVLAAFSAMLLGVLLTGGAGWFAGCVAIAFASLPALALVAGAQAETRRDRLGLLASAVAGIGGLSLLLGFGIATGVDPGAWLAARFGAAVPELLGFYRNAGWTESSLATLARVLRATSAVIELYLPGIVLCGCAVYGVVLTYGFGGVAGLDRRGGEEASFARYTTPVWAAVLFVPAGMAAVLLDGARLAVDVLLPLLALFFLRGLAIIRALLDRGRAGLLGRALVYALVLQMPFPLILALGGLFDEFWDFRARLDRKVPADE